MLVSSIKCTAIHPDAFGDQNLKPGVCYLASDTGGGFLDARAFCQGLGGGVRWDVADIENSTEQQIIKTNIDRLQNEGKM